MTINDPSAVRAVWVFQYRGGAIEILDEPQGKFKSKQHTELFISNYM